MGSLSEDQRNASLFLPSEKDFYNRTGVQNSACWPGVVFRALVTPYSSGSASLKDQKGGMASWAPSQATRETLLYCY